MVTLICEEQSRVVLLQILEYTGGVSNPRRVPCADHRLCHGSLVKGVIMFTDRRKDARHFTNAGSLPSSGDRF